MVNRHPAKPNSAANHIILGVVTYKPREFASQMNLGLNNGWGVVITIVDLVRGISAGEDGDKKYVLVKDPNKQVIGLYEVPLTTSTIPALSTLDRLPKIVHFITRDRLMDGVFVAGNRAKKVVDEMRKSYECDEHNHEVN